MDIRWSPPMVDWVAINSDGAVKTSLCVVGCGGTICDSRGGWLGGFAKRLFVSSAYLAELWGAMEGLKLALLRGFTSIELQMDSTFIVECLNGTQSGSAAGRRLLGRIRQMLACFTSVRVIHIYREANKVADELANMGCTYDDIDPSITTLPLLQLNYLLMLM